MTNDKIKKDTNFTYPILQGNFPKIPEEWRVPSLWQREVVSTENDFSFWKPSNFITHISFIFLLIKLFWEDNFWTLTLSALPWKFCSSTVYTKNIYLNLTNVLIFELTVNNCKPPEVGTKTAVWRGSPQSRQTLCPNLDSAVGYVMRTQ